MLSNNALFTKNCTILQIRQTHYTFMHHFCYFHCFVQEMLQDCSKSSAFAELQLGMLNELSLYLIRLTKARICFGNGIFVIYGTF